VLSYPSTHKMDSIKKAPIILLLAGVLLLSCSAPAPVTDDSTRLRALRADLVQLSVETPQMYNFPKVDPTLVQGHVVALTIMGRGLTKLPKSVYQFHHLRELALEQTAFSSLPDLTPLTELTTLTVEYNLFRGPVQLRNLPPSLVHLTLDRDAITEVLVADSLPRLSYLNLNQNPLQSHINSTFCKLPNLTVLKLSAGCCPTEKQRIALEKAAKKVLCNNKVAVRVATGFID
jgi:hypothetical protein